MGKKSGTSWLTIVKRAFRSPGKDGEKKGSRRREEEHDQEEEEKKREKRRWLFRKQSSNIAPQVQQQQYCEEKATAASASPLIISTTFGSDQKHAIAVAAATAAAAEAAAVTAQAAAEIVRLTRRPSGIVREQRAAVIIQTAFRRYLARRALRALRGLVKLQALVRGQNVRRQAKLTLKCMQALVRVQDRIRDQRARLSHDQGSRKSDLNVDLWEPKCLHDLRDRNSTSRDASSTLDEWDDRARGIEEVEAIVQSRKDAALKREKALAYAFSTQMWRSMRNTSSSVGSEQEIEERTKWLDRWMATRQWDNSRASVSDRRDSNIKTVEVDTTTTTTTTNNNTTASRPHTSSHYYQYSSNPNNHTPRRSMHGCPLNNQQQQHYFRPHSPITPSPSKPRLLHVRSASPRCLKEERCSSAAHTPSFGSRVSMAAGCRGGVPNYMAVTESAKAKARSLSAPRQRPSTPERDRGSSGGGGGLSARKRLSYPIPPEPHYGGYGRSSFSQSLRSPSFKSVCNGYVRMEQRSNYSCYTDSVNGGGEISPCSTSDLRWLK